MPNCGSGVPIPSVLAEIEQRLPPAELAQIITDSVKYAKTNPLAESLLDLYLERERQKRIEQYKQLDIEQKTDKILNDPEYLNALNALLTAEHTDRRLVINASYWRIFEEKYGTKSLLEVKSLIDQTLKTLENIQKQELDN